MDNSFVHQLLEIIADTKNWLYQENRFQVVSYQRDAEKPVDFEPQTKMQKMQELNQRVTQCQQCSLASSRTQTVFGSGDINSPLLIIGEAPGFEEDKQGYPFVGKAGELLTKMLKAIDLQREKVYICNVLKCRPPQNRNPQADEVVNCYPFLEQQIEIIDPKIILTLGNFATQRILETNTGISRLRGKTYHLGGRIVVPTYHPSALLQNPQLKRPAWHDLKLLRLVLQKMGIESPG